MNIHVQSFHFFHINYNHFFNLILPFHSIAIVKENAFDIDYTLKSSKILIALSEKITLSFLTLTNFSVNNFKHFG